LIRRCRRTGLQDRIHIQSPKRITCIPLWRQASTKTRHLIRRGDVDEIVVSVTAAGRICCRRASSNVVARSKRLSCVYASYGIFGIRRIVEAKEDWISSTYIVSLKVENVVAPIAAMAALPKNYPIAGCIDDRPARVLKS